MIQLLSDIKGNGPPTKSTPGAVGQIYVDRETGLRYECTEANVQKGYKIDKSFYTWEERGLDPDFIATDAEVAKAVDDLRKEIGTGGGSGGGGITVETDPTVPDWAKTPEKPRYTADEVYFDSDLILTEQFGKYKPVNGKVRVPAENKSVKATFLDAYSEDKNPAITQPNVGISSGTAKAYEVGTKVTPAYTGSFNPGKYEYGPDTGVTAMTWEATNTVTSEKKTTQNGSFAEYTVPDGANYKITLKCTYSDGAIPMTALEAEYPTGQIKSATKTVTSGAITGYRNSFYGTLTDKNAELTSDLIRGLAQKSGKALAKGNAVTVNVPVGAMAVVFAYPASLGELSSIKDVNGMNAEILSAFTAQTIAVNGANGYSAVDYRVYVQLFASPNDKANTYTVKI